MSVDDHLHDGVLEIAVELAIRIVGLDQENTDNFFFRIDSEVCAVSAIPAVAARGNALVGGDGVVDDLHAEAVGAAGQATGEGVGHKHRGHQLERFGAQQTLAIALAAVQQHLDELGVFLRAGINPPPPEK